MSKDELPEEEILSRVKKILKNVDCLPREFDEYDADHPLLEVSVFYSLSDMWLNEISEQSLLLQHLGRKCSDLPELPPTTNPEAGEEETIEALILDPFVDEALEVKEYSKKQPVARTSTRVSKRSQNRRWLLLVHQFERGHAVHAPSR
jgi:hypothetical protein